MKLFSHLWGPSASSTMNVKHGSKGGERTDYAESAASRQNLAKTNLEASSPHGSMGPQSRNIMIDGAAASPVVNISGKRKSTKHVATQPLYVPSAAEPRAPPVAVNHQSEESGRSQPVHQPSLSAEEAMARIQTLLRPPTPVAREVSFITAP